MYSITPARNAAVPLLYVETQDCAQTMNTLIAEVEADQITDTEGKPLPLSLLRWDFARGLMPLNKTAEESITAILPAGSNLQIKTTNPVECVGLLAKLPANSIVFFLNPHKIWTNPQFVQGVWNLRDTFKSNNRMLVMLAPSAAGLPDELKNDTVVVTDTLPTDAEILEIVDRTLDGVSVTVRKEHKAKALDALRGLTPFSAETVLSMSLCKQGIDVNALYERKRKMIEQTPGLSVYRGQEKFSDIGGYANVKMFMNDICEGNAAPRCIVFIDEIEKCMAGSSSDSSGVSQDFLRTLLTWMQDRKAKGVIFIGPPGSGKSAVAKATGNEAGVPTIALDLGGMKSSLVGSSEARLRAGLAVVDAVAQGQVLVIATCNSIGTLPPELRRRFSLGTFFFPLPSANDRQLIWNHYLKKYNMPDTTLPNDTGWTGAEIENCCDIAWRLKRSLVEAAKFIVPVAVAAQDQIAELCSEAHNRYINAAESGLFKYEKTVNEPQTAPVRRSVKLN